MLFHDRDPWPPCVSCPLEISATGTAIPRVPGTAMTALWDPFTVTIADAPRFALEDLEHSAPLFDEDAEARNEVEAITMHFETGCAYFEPNQAISRLDRGNISEVAAKSLLPDDRIILIDGGARKDLFDLLVEQLEELPEFTAVVLLIQDWQERVRAGFIASGFTYQEILDRLAGSAIRTSATIGGWIRGSVHGPKDPLDIQRFGRVIGDDVLIEQWEMMGKALETMRRHRRKFGRMLASALSGVSESQLE